nr:fumarylacetoacetate hydrolase family protein [Alkalilacustris brevis]
MPIQGETAFFPIRRVYCVGRNYAAHAREMGHDPDREPPFFFTKPADAVVSGTGDVPYPPATQDLHHEIELIVALKADGVDVPVEEASKLIFGYGVGVDLTRRDMQSEAKKMGRPWDMSKGFDASAPCSPLVPVENAGDMSQGEIGLSVNGDLRQKGDLAQMIWKTEEVIAYLSRLMRLRAGDIIMTGTPEGVGAIAKGDHVKGWVTGLPGVDFRLR